VAAKYQYSCYQLQTSAILYFNGGDYAQTARACDGAPANLISVCYQSLGRDVSGSTLRDPEQSIELCRLGSDPHWTECLVGVVKEMINAESRIDRGLSFCQDVPAEGKESCYGAVGQMVLSLYPDTTVRDAECARVEDDYESACREAARL
jgi:hypothetical protein